MAIEDQILPQQDHQGPVKADVEADEKELGSTGVTPSPASSELEPVVTVKTWIVAVLMSCGYGLSFWPIPTVAQIGTLISADMGEPHAYVWFVSSWNISVTVSFMIFGANTDLLGRRWFLVGGNLLCAVGHLIAGLAKESGNANQITAGFAITGFGAACAQMSAFALPELLPNKWRHIAVVIADGLTYIAIIVSPITGRYSYESDSWEWNFYGPAIFQFLSFLGLFFLYFPPAHPYGIPVKQVLREIDYPGIVLFTASAVPILLGIVWAGIYPSTDAHVVAPLAVGFALLVLFGVWENVGHPRHALAPPRIFASAWGRDFTAPALALTITNMFYYSTSILWPTMITVFYTAGGADWRYGTLLTLPQGCGILAGAMVMTKFGSSIRRWQWQLTGSVAVMVLFGSLLGIATPYNKGAMAAFVFVAHCGFGWAIPLSIMLSQMGVEHRDLGISGGVSGAFRFAGGAVATSVYQTIFNNKIVEWTPKLVVPAALKAGLDESRVAELLSVVSTSKLATSFSPAVVAAASEALKQAYCKAIFVVAMTSMAFGIVAIICCLLCKDVDEKMDNKIEVYLENDEYADRNKFH